MLIDWFTVGAQTLNFLVLVWLLKRFLYKPIVHAIDEREKKIAAQLAGAAAKMASAEKAEADFKTKNATFDKERAGLMTAAKDAAEAERRTILASAHDAADALSAKRRESLESEAKRINRAIASRTEKNVFAIARKALADLADVTLEERMVHTFVNRLQKLDDRARKALLAAAATAKGAMVVRTSMSLAPDLTAVIEATVKHIFGDSSHIDYVTTPDLISGIELDANGQKVAWTLAEYLQSLQTIVDEQFSAKAKPASSSEPAPVANTPEANGSAHAP